jgi:pantothenate kinase
MKTAMQELIELLELNTTNEPLPHLIDVIKEVYIEKEKEQIQEWYAKGWEEATKIGIEESHKYQDLINQNK